jgi:hypothetical protein
MADNFVDIAKQFCDFYYQTFDADRKQLGPLYRDQSMLTYESSSVQGVAAIVDKLAVRQSHNQCVLIGILRGGTTMARARAITLSRDPLPMIGD